MPSDEIKGSSDEIIQDIIDRVLSTPQANRVIDGLIGLFDRVGNSIDSTLNPPPPHHPTTPRATARARARARAHPKHRARAQRREKIAEYYKILGLAPDADLNEIKTTYRHLMRKHHPDHSPLSKERATQISARITEAYRELEILLKSK